MARQNGQLADWGDEIPQEVLDLAEEYDLAHTKKSEASAEVNTARDNLIDKMKELKVARVPIRNGAKFLTIQIHENVRYQKPKKSQDDDWDDEPVSRPVASAPAPAPVSSPAPAAKRTRKAKATSAATKPSAEPGPDDPPASAAASRFNLGTPFAGLDVPAPWLAAFASKGFEDCWDLLAAEANGGLKSLGFADANIDALKNALGRWRTTGHYIDGCAAAYEEGVIAFSQEREGEQFNRNSYATDDPRSVRWRDGWLEAESTAEPVGEENEDDE